VEEGEKKRRHMNEKKEDNYNKRRNGFLK